MLKKTFLPRFIGDSYWSTLYIGSEILTVGQNLITVAEGVFKVRTSYISDVKDRITSFQNIVQNVREKNVMKYYPDRLLHSWHSRLCLHSFIADAFSWPVLKRNEYVDLNISSGSNTFFSGGISMFPARLNWKRILKKARNLIQELNIDCDVKWFLTIRNDRLFSFY